MSVRVLFVCLGNICRSPSAEAVLRQQAQAAGITLDVDSAGTGNWHVGAPPDGRSIASASRRGMDMRALRARQVCAEDFICFTHIFAMDQRNLADLQAMRPTAGVTPQLFLGCAPDAGVSEVPDPYYGGPEGFEHMLDLIEIAAKGFLQTLH
ncbi:MAG: protein-tyrosine-phosphatase [Robiginitomaculum sp.]|nr:MAG: protein-tyrosine-phosphatase [Robiginitomaculum sp.]